VVVLSFVGKVATVAGNPVGLTGAAYNKPVSGKLGYLDCIPDAKAADPKRGEYEHNTGGIFELNVQAATTVTVTGSTKPVVQIEDLNPDTFRFKDGDQPLDPKVRIMSLNGQPDPSLSVWLAITDSSGAAFSDDSLPKQFPFTNISAYPHTFSVKDSNGTLLLQLSSITQL
jgi:hypothetical protein